MFIQTEVMPDPARMKFFPGREVLPREVLPTGPLDLHDETEAAASPLAERLFAIPGVTAVSLDKDCITITRGDGDWQHLKPAILGAIMSHFMSGVPTLRDVGAPSQRRSADPAAKPDIQAVDRIRQALRQVIDPELGYNIVDLGLIYDIVAGDGGAVSVVMTTTTPGCPATNYLRTGAGEAASAVDGVEFVDVQLTYEPHWTPQMMTPEAKKHFGIRDEGGL